jgi:phosphatidylinositol 4-kinase
MYREILIFINEHFHVFVAKGIPLMEFVQILKVNFLLDPTILEFLPLESICLCLTTHLQLVNLLKASVEQGEALYDEAFIDDFYIKSLKIGLFHFQKRRTFFKEELIAKHNNIKSLNTKINFFIQICDYLRNDDFHRFRKKKLPKRDEIFGKSKTDDNLLYSILKYTKQKNFFNSKVNSAEDEVEAQRQNHVVNEYEFDMTVLRYCLLYLISEQIDRIKAYSYMELEAIENPYSLAGKKKFINHEQIMKLYEYFGESSSVLIYNFLKVFGRRIDNPSIIMDKLKEVITVKPDYGFPEFLGVFIDNNRDRSTDIKKINYWKPPNVHTLFKYLSQEYEQYPYLQLYVTKVLSRLHSDQILFYLPQIFQTLALSTGQIIYDFLIEYAKSSPSFAHQLIWISKVESKVERDRHNNNPRLPGVEENLEKLGRIAGRLIKDTIRQFSREEKSFFKEVDSFYEEVTAVSGKLNNKWSYA